MTSILRPTRDQMTRRLVVLAAAAFAVLIPAVQGLADLGLSQAEFAADGNQTLRVAGYAFSIWGLIYLGLIAYALRQALPQTGESAFLGRFGWPSATAFVGIGLWIVVAAMNLKAASVVIIFASLLALLVPFLLNAGLVRTLGASERDRWLGVWPLAALTGWLTIASPLNLITVATAYEALPSILSPTGWAVAAVLVTSLVAVAVTARIRTLAYPLPIAWGLIGAFVAEQERNPTLAFTALAAALAIVVAGVILVFRLKRDIAREPASRSG